jgi:hypothetical protein
MDRASKSAIGVIPAKLTPVSASPNPGGLDSRFPGKECARDGATSARFGGRGRQQPFPTPIGEGTFRTNEVRILRKAPDVSPRKFTLSLSVFGSRTGLQQTQTKPIIASLFRRLEDYHSFPLLYARIRSAYVALGTFRDR